MIGVPLKRMLKRYVSPDVRARLRRLVDRWPWKSGPDRTMRNDRCDLRYKFHLTNYRGEESLQRVPVPRIEFTDPRFDHDRDVAVASRLIDAFHATERAYGGDLGAAGVWRYHELTTFDELLRHLHNRDAAALARLLSGLFRTKLTNGMGMGVLDVAGVQADPDRYALIWHDRALTLAAAVGLMHVENPEAGAFGERLQCDSVAAFDRLIENLGGVRFPQVGGCFGVRVRGEIVPLNYLQHVYAAFRMRSLARGRSWDALEIGGGFGGLAYAATLLGAKRYTLIDLAPVNVIQGWFLLNSEFRDRVVLFGEPGEDRDDRIFIAGSGHLREVAVESCDIVVNQDSLPEMSRETAAEFLRLASRVTRRYFLSLNQEHQAFGADRIRQNWVHELCRTTPGFALDLVVRCPYWMRVGYVEELYVKAEAEAVTACAGRCRAA
jgi:hypothetical protein